MTRRAEDAAVGSDVPDGGIAAAMLVIRVWNEPGTSEPGLRARLTSRRRIDDEECELAVAADVETVVAQVRSWLVNFLAH